MAYGCEPLLFSPHNFQFNILTDHTKYVGKSSSHDVSSSFYPLCPDSHVIRTMSNSPKTGRPYLREEMSSNPECSNRHFLGVW